MQTPFSPLSFGKSFMKIRSAVPENGCLVLLWRTEKNGKKTKTSVKHIRIRLIGGCVNYSVKYTKTVIGKMRNAESKMRNRKMWKWMRNGGYNAECRKSKVGSKPTDNSISRPCVHLTTTTALRSQLSTCVTVYTTPCPKISDTPTNKLV